MASNSSSKECGKEFYPNIKTILTSSSSLPPVMATLYHYSLPLLSPTTLCYYSLLLLFNTTLSHYSLLLLFTTTLYHYSLLLLFTTTLSHYSFPLRHHHPLFLHWWCHTDQRNAENNKIPNRPQIAKDAEETAFAAAKKKIPANTGHRSPRMRKKLLLPQPFGPHISVFMPRFTSSDRFSFFFEVFLYH